jgi:hypothetical protein
MASIHVPALNLFAALSQGFTPFEIAVALDAPFDVVKELVAANQLCFRHQIQAISVLDTLDAPVNPFASLMLRTSTGSDGSRN